MEFAEQHGAYHRALSGFSVDFGRTGIPEETRSAIIGINAGSTIHGNAWGSLRFPREGDKRIRDVRLSNLSKADLAPSAFALIHWIQSS